MDFSAPVPDKRATAALRREVCVTMLHQQQKRTLLGALLLLVEHRGFEPLTPTLPVLCAPNCANAPTRSIIAEILRVVKSVFENVTKCYVFRRFFSGLTEEEGLGKQW